MGLAEDLKRQQERFQQTPCQVPTAVVQNKQKA